MLGTIADTTEFTNEWAQVVLKMVTAGASHSAVRDLTLAFKHKAFKDLNSFQRLLRASENDHYQLFRYYLDCAQLRQLLNVVPLSF